MDRVQQGDPALLRYSDIAHSSVLWIECVKSHRKWNVWKQSHLVPYYFYEETSLD